MNPNLFKNHAFVDRLTKQLERFASSLPASFTDPQVYWELLKTSVQQTAKSFGRRHVQWRAQQLRLLQRKRNRILREQRNHGMLPLLLEIIERQIGALQQEITANNILRAGRHWRENGETSAGYLKKTISTRASSRYIPKSLHV
ncbi:hypothetical protein G6F41_014131 [Rhizopus arrhizus]|nr:hypothetical protein G6F41_014131 [Rhizopus arrhizus]